MNCQFKQPPQKKILKKKTLQINENIVILKCEIIRKKKKILRVKNKKIKQD